MCRLWGPTHVPSHYQHVPTVCDACMEVRRERMAIYRLEFSKWAHTSRTTPQPVTNRALDACESRVDRSGSPCPNCQGWGCSCPQP